MPELNKSVAALRIFGDSLVPEEISHILGHVPTDCYKKGDIYPSKSKDVVRKTGMWSLQAKSLEPGNLNTQVVELVRQLTQDLKAWKQLSQNFEIDLYCGLFLAETNEDFNLSVTTLEALANRGIKLNMSIYGATED